MYAFGAMRRMFKLRHQNRRSFTILWSWLVSFYLLCPTLQPTMALYLASIYGTEKASKYLTFRILVLHCGVIDPLLFRVSCSLYFTLTNGWFSTQLGWCLLCLLFALGCILRPVPVAMGNAALVNTPNPPSHRHCWLPTCIAARAAENTWWGTSTANSAAKKMLARLSKAWMHSLLSCPWTNGDVI